MNKNERENAQKSVKLFKIEAHSNYLQDVTRSYSSALYYLNFLNETAMFTKNSPTVANTKL